MSLSIHHVRHAELTRTSYSSIESARLDVENNRAGQVTDFWQEQGGVGFLFQPLDLDHYSVFLQDQFGVIFECALYSHWPID